MPITKIDLPSEYWDQLFAPSSCLAMITTVDAQGIVNAATFGTCTRVNHNPVYIAFTVGRPKHTALNVLETGEFTVNLPKHDRTQLEAACNVSLPFARGVDELQRAGLTALAAKTIRPPRILECPRHFECQVEWTREWVGRLMVVGKVLAVSADSDCIDESFGLIWDKARSSHFCGHPHGGKFVAAYEVMEVTPSYDGPEAALFNT
jgi:flavin reductase (DIM6/NTAB) family NADH-FMN oxidoreductase RutF